MSRVLVIIFGLCLVMLQYRIWFADDSVLELVSLKREQARQSQEIAALSARNDAAYDEIVLMKEAVDYHEEQAREELGMIKPNERYYQIVEPQ